MSKIETITSFNSDVDIALEVKGYDPMKELIEYNISRNWYEKKQTEEDLPLYISAAIDILNNRGLDINEILDAPFIK